MNRIEKLIHQLEMTTQLENHEMLELLSHYEDENVRQLLADKARKVAQNVYGKQVYTRGLIEFSNFCRNNCYYCGIQRNNKNISRYRLTKDKIMACCEEGYFLGFRTFVLQSGEDMHYDDDMLCDIVASIRQKYPDCAITLSLGEKDRESYQRFFDAGANRYLLRHETANDQHYRLLHPSEMSLKHRKKCLFDLKEIGYQVGCGIMVGSPHQTLENIVEDIQFMKELQPHMIGIGPFVPHHDTIFKDEKTGSLHLTLMLLSILRLSFPHCLLPATTALGTIHPRGREMGILAGANVVMPNLSPVNVRKKYELYDHKICTGEEAAECRFCLSYRIKGIGYEIVSARGDYKE